MLDKKPHRVVLHFKHFKHVVYNDHTCSTNFITTFQIIKTNPIEFTTHLQKRKEFSTTQKVGLQIKEALLPTCLMEKYR